MEINTLAAVLSAIYPGIGQLKNLDITKGLFLLLFFTMVLLMAFYPGSQLQIVGYVLIPMVWVWSVVDASQIFMHRPGAAVSPSTMQKALIRVALGWLVLELIFVPLMVLWPRNGNHSAQPTPDSQGNMSQQFTLPKDLASLPNRSVEPEMGTSLTTQQEEPTIHGPDRDKEESDQPWDAEQSSQAEPTPREDTDGTPEQPSATPSGDGTFAVSLGIFVGPVQADEQRNAAVQAGFNATVSRVRLGENVHFIVLVPGYDTQSEAAKIRDSLQSHSRFKDSAIVRHSKLNIIE